MTNNAPLQFVKVIGIKHVNARVKYFNSLIWYALLVNGPASYSIHHNELFQLKKLIGHKHIIRPRVLFQNSFQ